MRNGFRSTCAGRGSTKKRRSTPETRRPIRWRSTATPPPPTTEPVDLTQFKDLKFDELKMTTEVEMPTNIVTSRNPAAGSLNANLASALAAVPVAAASDALSSQILSATSSLALDPPISKDQVVLMADDLAADERHPGPSRSPPRPKKDGKGAGDEDGFATLDDLLTYSGPMTEDRTAMMPTDLLFEYNSAELKDSARLSLMKLGFIIQKNPEAEISIEGHTDTFGGDAYNQNAQRGARRRRQKLARRVAAARCRPPQHPWLGKSKLLVPGGDVDVQQKNRRVEIVIRPKK